MNSMRHRFGLRQKKILRSYEIDYTLYEALIKLSNIYDASIPELLNFCVERLIESEKICFYTPDNTNTKIKRPYHMKETNLIGLNRLKEKYGVSIFKLVNMSIYNMLEEIKAD